MDSQKRDYFLMVNNKKRNFINSSRFPCDGGESGHFFRSYNWTQHPLGPIPNWPSSLKNSLNILYHSKQPMLVWWGEDLYQFYNDAFYTFIINNSYHQVLGQSAKECWLETWNLIQPQIELIFSGSGLSWQQEEQRMILKSESQQHACIVNSGSPIFNEDGDVGGALLICTEFQNKAKQPIDKPDSNVQFSLAEASENIGFLEWNAKTGSLYLSESLMVELGMDSGSFEHTLAEFLALIHPFDRNRVWTEMQKTIFEQKAFDVEYRVIRPGGEEIWINSKGCYLLNSDREPERLVGFANNITTKAAARKIFEDNEIEMRNANRAAQQTRDELYSFFMQAPAPMFILSGPGHRFMLANPQYEKFVGRAVVGKKMSEAFLEDDIVEDISILDSTFRTGSPFVGKSMPLRFSDRDFCSKEFRVDLSFTPFRDSDGEVKGILGFILDITDDYIVRANLEEYNIELRSAKAEADRANELKSAFLANMSHEIRTPLGAILGFTEILKNTTVNEADHNHYLEIISRNGHALTKIIDDILDLSKIEAGKLEIEMSPLCLSELTQDVMSMFRDRASGKGLTIQFRDNLFPNFIVDSDPVRIRQVLVNLIGNAVKFTSHGSVTIDGYFKVKNDDSIVVSILISDSGSGMTLDQAMRLFRPFTQGDNTSSRRYGGTGLGLALSQKLGRALGGDVTLVDCEVGKGCTFKFEFEAGISKVTDIEYAGLSPSSIQRQSLKSLAGYSILVVDDSPDNRTLIDLILTREGASVELASCGEEALQMALSGNYNAVLMDIQMPGLDGYETLSRLRSEKFKSPVLALTAHAMYEERARAIASGFSEHISKPINPKYLIESILVHARPYCIS